MGSGLLRGVVALIVVAAVTAGIAACGGSGLDGEQHGAPAREDVNADGRRPAD
jgi:hypothetical protein